MEDGATHPWRAAYPAGIAWAAAAPTGTLCDLFDRSAERFGSRPCLDFLGRRWSYAETADLVARAAAGLRRLGVAPGDRVGLCLPNTPFSVIGFFAVLRLGAVVVNFSPLSAAPDLAAQAADSGVSVIFASDLEPSFSRLHALLDRGAPRRLVVCRMAWALGALRGGAFRLTRRKLLARVPRDDPRLTGFDRLLAAAPLSGPVSPPVAGDEKIRPDDLAVLQYTGGTTGTPKGVMLSHANLVANAAQVSAWFPRADAGAERILAVLPLFHVFAMTTAMTVPLGMGALILLLPRYERRQFRAALRRGRPTLVPGVPTLFKAMLDANLTRADLASVKIGICGGAPLPLEVKRAWDRRFPAAVLLEGYGLTEASPVCFCNPADGSGRDGTIGLPLPLVEARIRDPEAPDIALPLGARGELQVRGPNVMRGYFNRPDETRDVLSADGWLRTGDVGEMAADGYVTLVDRIKDLILCGGFNVYPRHVEDALYRHPDVAAATVVGMPDPYRGESVAAFIQPRPGARLDEAGVLAFLADKLSPVEMPRHVAIRAELPRTAIGKLSRKELRAELVDRKPAE